MVPRSLLSLSHGGLQLLKLGRAVPNSLSVPKRIVGNRHSGKDLGLCDMDTSERSGELLQLENGIVIVHATRRHVT